MWRSDIKAILKRTNMGLALSKPLACRTGVIFICVCVSQAYRRASASLITRSLSHAQGS